MRWGAVMTIGMPVVCACGWCARCSRKVSRIRLPMCVRVLTFVGAMTLALHCGAIEARTSGPRRTQPIDMVVIHSTGGPTCDAKTGKPIWVKAGTLADDILSIEAHPKLGIHYMIDRDGTVRSSVPEDRIAHHVFGYSARSIAIELVNDGDGVDSFPEAQLDATVTLIRDIARRRGVTRHGVKMHSDLDHGFMTCDRTKRRKVDPGSAFPYEAVLDAAFRPR
jgi:N-acetylmuramoyl-L-alanine amidase